MATTKKPDTNTFLKSRLAKVNKVINRLEGEVEKAVGKFVRRGEKSSKVIKKNLDEILDRISTSDLYSRATEKKEELRSLADDVINKLKGFDIKKANTLLKDIRGSINEIVEKVQESNLIELAKGKAVNTRKQVLSALNIPSQDDVDKISRKVVSLEKKIKTLSRKAA